MPTLFEYFRSDFTDLSIDTLVMVNYCKINKLTGSRIDFKLEVQLRLQQDIHSSARMFIFYVPQTSDTGHVCKILLENLDNLFLVVLYS